MQPHGQGKERLNLSLTPMNVDLESFVSVLAEMVVVCLQIPRSVLQLTSLMCDGC